jgi:SAM-dependent methyltransferase
MHKDIYKKFHKLNDSKWIELLFKSVNSQVINGISFPGFPEDSIQVETIGNHGISSLYEPKYMYQEIRRITELQNKRINKKTTFLDFACGYGRMTRFFMKDIFPGNLYGSDVTEEFINLCKNTFCINYNKKMLWKSIEIKFDINNPFPPLKYENKTFDIIMAYSLFSHLSEDAHIAWLREFLRILKTDGLIFLTIRQQNFLTDLKKLSISNNISDYERKMIEKFGNTSIKKRFDNGEYIYSPSGGGYKLTNDFYGDTVIPNQYIYNKWGKWFDIIEHYDDSSRLMQAFICLKPKGKNIIRN